MMLFKVDLGQEQKWRYHLGVSGFSGCTIGNRVEELLDRVRAIHSDEPLLVVQLFDARKIATYLHLLASAVYALQAFKGSRNISRSIGTESLLYASARRQINDAIDRVGLKATSQTVAANVIGSRPDTVIESMKKVHQELGGQVDDDVLSIGDLGKTEVILRTFEIGDIEVEAARTETGTRQAETAVMKRVLSKMSVMAISS